MNPNLFEKATFIGIGLIGSSLARVFKKKDFEDSVIIGLDLPKGNKEIDVSSIYKDGEILIDKYSNKEVEVNDGKVTLKTEFNFVLLELK